MGRGDIIDHGEPFIETERISSRDIKAPWLVPRLIGCARCGGDGHDGLTFYALQFPVEHNGKIVATHWTSCPTNGEPILAEICGVVDEAQA